LVELKTASDLALMRRAGAIAAEVADEICELIGPGRTTRELDRLAERRIRALGGRPGFKGLYGFPASVCVSVNDEVVHGVPGARVLADGDIVSVDIGVVYQGFCADMAFTRPVGEVSGQALQLLEVASAALADAVAAARPGGHLGDIGAAVQRRAERAGFSVVRDYGGHGIGRRMHEDPWIANFGVPGTGLPLAPGMTLALEPMVNIGACQVKTVDRQGWQVIVTADGSLSAHFEHTVAVTPDGPVILTARSAG
jgi:methionyl aminopeptidase